MKHTLCGILWLSLVWAPYASSGAAESLQRLKTAILPSGGFYSLYQGTCDDKSQAWIARLEGGARWCARSGEALSCYRRSAQALQTACSFTMAASEASGQDTQSYH